MMVLFPILHETVSEKSVGKSTNLFPWNLNDTKKDR